MNNTISENVGICNRDDSCGAAGLIIENDRGSIFLMLSILKDCIGKTAEKVQSMAME